ncbi:MAG: YggT family protein [Xanthomonadales bacterium]|nr:YggT family protein [Xanthomonadales bacterium]
MNNLQNAGSWLFEILLTFYSISLLLRLLLQWVKADYHNPLVQLLIMITDPLVKPLRKALPAWGRLDSACLLLFILCTTIIVTLWDPMASTPMLIAARSIIRVLQVLLSLYSILIIISIILSWVGQSFKHPIIPLVYQLTEPLLIPIRKFLPSSGGFDFSAVIALITIHFLRLLLGY